MGRIIQSMSGWIQVLMSKTTYLSDQLMYTESLPGAYGHSLICLCYAVLTK